MGTEKLTTEVRQEQIVQAALSLAGSQGMRGLSVAGVARRVGLVPSAIYRHFQSKDQLVDALIDHLGEGILGNIRAVRQETSDPMARLQRLLMRQARFIRENQAIPRIIFSEEVHGRNPQKKARIYGFFRRFIGGVADIVREGQQEGSIRADLDAETLALVFVGLFQPAAVLWHLSEGVFDVTRHAGRAWEVMSQAIRARSDSDGKSERTFTERVRA